MFGGLAVAKNLLCVAYSEVRGKLFLVDLEERRLVSFWEYGPEEGGYADAGGVAVTADFHIFVADTRNDLVRRFSPFGVELGHIGQPASDPPGSARRDRNGSLDRPRALAVRDDVLYVACGERKLQRGVQRFGLRGGAMRPLRAFGEAEARFGAPRGLCAWDEGLLVADTLHGVVQRFGREGRFIGHLATGRQPGESSRPIAVLALSRDELLVVEAGDEPGVRRFGLDGGARPLPESTATLPEPVDLARDEQGRVYVLYQDGERVVRLDAELRPDVDVFDFAEVLHG